MIPNAYVKNITLNSTQPGTATKRCIGQSFFVDKICKRQEFSIRNVKAFKQRVKRLC